MWNETEIEECDWADQQASDEFYAQFEDDFYGDEL